MTRKQSFSMLAAIAVLLMGSTVGNWGLRSANAEDLLILLPYKAVSDVPIQEARDWIAYGMMLADYKSDTGLSAAILTLDDVNASYAGVDEAARVKQAIYEWVVGRSVRYVMLVGDMGVFPVRYLMRGYSSEGWIYWSSSATYCRAPDPVWCIADLYFLYACDAYYSNLWDNDDALQQFDDWNDSGDELYGELYCDTIRGTDGNTIHPDVALGRVPCADPAGFHRYIVKVMVYENRVGSAYSRNTALMVAGELSGSPASVRRIGDTLGSSFEVTYLERTGTGSFEAEDPSGAVTPVGSAAGYIYDFIDDHEPRFVVYHGHGAPTSWSEASYGNLFPPAQDNLRLPAIVAASACDTARFAREYEYETIPTDPDEGADWDCMAEAFLTESHGGGVIYLGAVAGMRAPAGHFIDEAFFQAIADGAEHAGDAWRSAIEAYIDRHDSGALTQSTWVEVDDWPDPDRDGHWDSNLVTTRIYHVYDYHFFGDPSLRLEGVTVADTEQPTTVAFLERWVNREALRGPQPHEHHVRLVATDRETGVATTHYRWRIHEDDALGDWLVGTEFDTPIRLERGMEGTESTLFYYSVDLVGRQEFVERETIGYDFTPPESTVRIDGEELETSVDTVAIRRGTTVTITATDELSGVWGISYTFADSGPGRFEFGSRVEIDFHPCFPMASPTLTYWATDFAGNEEERQTVTFDLAELAGLPDIACFKPEWLHKLYRFPPSIRDHLVGLRFHEKIADVLPTEVRYQFSGPVTQSYEAHQWLDIGLATRNPDEQTWSLGWDTQKFGIQNGWYWVRAVAGVPPRRRVKQEQEEVEFDPFPLLIDNLADGAYTLTAVSTDQAAVPGDKVEVIVSFQGPLLGELRNPAMGLIVDREFLLYGEDTPLVRTRASLQAGEEWIETFSLELDWSVSGPGELRVSAFVTSDEYAYLTSDRIAIPVLPRNILVAGKVLDTVGRPLQAAVVLKGGALTRNAETDYDGRFVLPGVPAGVYTLGILRAPAGYRVVTPESGEYRVIAVGRDLERNFVLAAADERTPVVTGELPWHEVVSHNVLYGLAYDDPYGTGVEQVAVAVRDRVGEQWLTGEGAWADEETWLEPDRLVSLADFLSTHLDNVLAELPEDRRDAERAKLEALSGRLTTRRECFVWTFALAHPSVLSGGWRTVLVRAEDGAGNAAVAEFANVELDADFAWALAGDDQPRTVQFTSQATGVAMEHEWDFGDGQTSVDTNPTHTYATGGTFAVTLTVHGPYGSDDATQDVVVPTKPSIFGTVTNRRTGQPIKKAKIKGRRKGGGRKKVKADVDGFYELTDLVEGTWKLTVTKKRYRKGRAKIKISDAEPHQQDFRLRPK